MIIGCMIWFLSVGIWKRVVVMERKGGGFSMRDGKIVGNKEDKKKGSVNYFFE